MSKKDDQRSDLLAPASGSATTVERTRTPQQEARWVDAWHQAYKWRADHWGKMPEQKHRRMLMADKRSDIAWKREREAVARSSSPSDSSSPTASPEED